MTDVQFGDMGVVRGFYGFKLPKINALLVLYCIVLHSATATLVHAFVTSWLDYCSTLYVGLPAVRLGSLERVIRTGTRLIGGIPRTGHVSAYMLDVLHWLPLQQRIMFRIGAMVWRCILGLAPAYLRDLCCPTSGTRGHSSLRSLEQGLLYVPFARTSTTQTRAFSVVGPSVWNGLPLSQRLLPRILSDTFYSTLKTLLSSNLEGALYKSL